MKTRVTDSIWLNDSDVCSIEYLAELSGLSLAEIRDLMENGVIAPVDPAADPAFFHLHCIVTAHTARRLRDDFELDRHGVAMALVLLQRIHLLETELQVR